MGWLLLIVIFSLSFLLTWSAYRRGRLATPWQWDVAALGLLALAALGFFWRVVAGQNWMPADGGDLVSFLFPTYRFAAASLRDGAWPLWNPYIYAGAPHVGDIQAGFLYPPVLLLFLLRPEFPYAALQWLSIGHIWFAGAGMYLFLARGQGVRRVAALAAALAFMFSDVFLTHFGNLNLNAAASWLPWVFWAYGGNRRMRSDGSLESANQRIGECDPMDRPNQRSTSSFILHPSSFVPALLLALATLAGHIQATLFIVLALVLYAALELWLARGEPQPGPRALAVLARLGLCLAVALLIAAPVLLPALQLTGYTARADWSYAQTAGYSLSPAQWIGWLIPGFFGRGPQFHWGAWPRVEVGYLGILPLVLAGLAFVLRRERRTWAFAGLAAASFVLALGIYAIPHGWLSLLPGFGLLRASARFVLLTDFALAALAGFGLDAALAPLAGQAQAAFERAGRLVGRATALVWAIAVPLAYAALLLVQDRDQAAVTRVSITLIAVVTFAGLLAACWVWLAARRGNWARTGVLGWLAAGLIFLDLAGLGAYQDLSERDPSAGFAQPEIAAFLAGQPGPFRIDTRTQIEALWQPDTALLLGQEDVGGVANPLVLADVERYWEGLGSRSTALYDLLNVRYVIARKDAPLDWDKFALAFDGDPDLNVYENRSVLPRAFVVAQVQPAADHEAAWQAIHAADFAPAANAVVEGDAAALAGVTGGQGQVSGVVRTGNRLRFEVAADAPAFVVISQVWYPGWQVRIDGQSTGAPLRTDYLFQGVAVPAGTHTVELRFAPLLWRLGWLLAGVGLLLAAGLAWLSRLRKGRRSS